MNLYPVSIEIENFGPYRGKNSVRLSDSVYAVVAYHADDSRRSNWLGKTMLLWCIPYALVGEHPKAIDDDIVTTGEKTSTVKLTLNDGSVISRSKTIGRSTYLEVTIGKSSKVLTQAAAQKAIERHIGLSKTDYMSTCFFAQKSLSQIVSSQNSTRFKVVEAWLLEDLAPIRAMHDEARAGLSKVVSDLDRNVTAIGLIESDLKELARKVPTEDIENLDTEISKVVSKVEGERDDAKKSLEAAKQARLAAADWAGKLQASAEFDRICVEGKRVASRLRQIGTGLDAKLEMAKSNFEEAMESVRAAKSSYTNITALACGEFSGQCPVNRRQCPSPDWVVSQGTTKESVNSLRKILMDKQSAADVLKLEIRSLEKAKNERAIVAAKLEFLRNRAKDLVAVANEVKASTSRIDVEELDAAVSSAEQIVSDRESKISTLVSIRDIVKHALADLDQLRHEIEKQKTRRTIFLEAVQLLGKTGAQQKIAEFALASIETGANSLLQSAGIQLEIGVRWETQAQGLSKQCDKCGTAFSPSAKVKECSCCKAPRGPHTVSNMAISLSNRSGAAEDLAGIAIGLAASQWLRVKKGSRWGCVCIDEPFGALDLFHKDALSIHISTLLNRSFLSSFVVAHDRSILDAMPSRVTIRADEFGSHLEQEKSDD